MTQSTIVQLVTRATAASDAAQEIAATPAPMVRPAALHNTIAALASVVEDLALSLVQVNAEMRRLRGEPDGG